MSSWQNKLKSWVNADILTKDQQESILKFEAEQSPSNNNWVLYGFILLGIGVLGTGIIALISANWEYIPESAKLMIDITLLTVIAAGIYQAQIKSNGIISDALILLLMFFTLGSLGLLSQIYHTGGEFYDAVLAVCVITIPLALISHYSFIPYIWTYSILGALTVNLLENSRYNDFDSINLFIFALTFLLGSITTALPSLKRFTVPFYSYALFLFFSLTCYFDFEGKLHDVPGQIIILNTAFLFSSFALLAFVKKLPRKHLVFLAATITSFYLLIFAADARSSEFIRAVLTITTGISLSLYFATDDRRKLFNLITLMVMFRFLGIFFQVFGSLMATGIGLIIAGFLILITAYVWYKTKDRLAILIKGGS